MVLLIDLGNLSEMELDILKELGNIGTGHAATSLSVLLNREVEMTVPLVRVIEIKNLSNEFISDIVEGIVIALQDLEGNTCGYLYVMFPDESSKKITSSLFGLEEVDEEMHASTIMEVGNILSSSFCDALADLMSIILLPSPPNFAVDLPTAVIDSVISQMGEKSDHIILFESSLSSDPEMSILLSMLPEPGMLEDIMKIMEQL
jgi:chemotaxis protein CheC